MKRECSIVRDVLPLYFENMVSEDTAVFVKENQARKLIRQKLQKEKMIQM